MVKPPPRYRHVHAQQACLVGRLAPLEIVSVEMGELRAVQSKEWTPNGRMDRIIDASDWTEGVATVTPAKAPPEAAAAAATAGEEEEDGDGMYSEDIYAQPEPLPVISVDTAMLAAGAPPTVAAAAAAEESDDDDGLNVVMDDSDAGAFSWRGLS
jgi:hypothetical protein